MGITIEELKKLDKNTYQIIDIRDENEIAHGAIPGAVATPADSIEGNENIDFSKKLVICCSRGRFSVEVAEGLEEKGMDAVSLEGGYIAWLLDAMKQEEEVDICKDVELSIRKKFRKSIVKNRTTLENTAFYQDAPENSDSVGRRFESCLAYHNAEIGRAHV